MVLLWSVKEYPSGPLRRLFCEKKRGRTCGDPCCPSESFWTSLLSRARRAFMDVGRATALGGRRPVKEALAIEIESLRKLKTKALQARYGELFGEATRSSNQAHLFRRIAWRLQAKAHGDLSERARKRAEI